MIFGVYNKYKGSNYFLKIRNNYKKNELYL